MSAFAWSAVAEVPTQKDFNAAGRVIADLLEPEMAAVKSGKKKPAQVADYALSLVGESDTAAAKFLLARRAYALYMQAGAFDKAESAIAVMRTTVPDMSSEQFLKAITPAANNVSEKKAPGVFAIISDLKGKVRSKGEVAKLEACLKTAKVSERDGINRQLGECYAVLGDWAKALASFAKSDGEVASMATKEIAGEADVNKLAGFWWDYAEDGTLKKSVSVAVRQHAIDIYKKGLADGTITGLNKKLAEQRVASRKESVISPSANGDIKKRIPMGLAHRWSFSGDMKDSVGGADGVIGGNGVLEAGQCVLNRGWIQLHRAASSFSGSFTLEIWTTERERALGSRVFKLKADDNRDAVFAWATGDGHGGWFHADHYAISTSGKECKDFELGKETYVAMTCKEVRDGYEITAYKYEPHTKKFSQFVAKMGKDRFAKIQWFSLGSRIVVCKKFSDAFSSFNECRVWTRCLSRSEIERSAKAGPDTLAL